MRDTKKETRVRVALDLLNSHRGRYLLGQALLVATEVMERVEPPYREESNIRDMRFMMENVPGMDVYAAIKELEKNRQG
jgi:hypothetical protein